MHEKINQLIIDIETKKQELIKEYEQLKKEYGYSFQKRKVVFDKKIKAYHKTFREGLLKYIFTIKIRHLISSPFIFVMIVPVSILDLFLLIYQNTCFRLYGIPLVERKDYIIFDRQHLQYLNALQKLNCMYCSYANGVFAYAVEIAGRTEKYRCPIKHAKHVESIHRRTAHFADYGDAEGFKTCFTSNREFYKNIRKNKKNKSKQN